MVSTLAEMSLAVVAIRKAYNKCHYAHQDGVEYQFIHWRYYNEVGNGQFSYSFQNTDIGKW